MIIDMPFLFHKLVIRSHSSADENLQDTLFYVIYSFYVTCILPVYD